MFQALLLSAEQRGMNKTGTFLCLYEAGILINRIPKLYIYICVYIFIYS